MLQKPTCTLNKAQMGCKGLTETEIIKDSAVTEYCDCRVFIFIAVLHYFSLSHVYLIPVRSFTISEAIISPAADGTNAELPGSVFPGRSDVRLYSGLRGSSFE